MARTHVSRWRSLIRRVALEDRVSLDRSRRADRCWRSEAEDRDEMWRLLGSLGPRQRAVVVLRYYEDLAERDIAQVLGCSVGTVKSQLSRALATLRREQPALSLVTQEDVR